MNFSEKIGYFHGRFQPFHLGHFEVINNALQKNKIVAIGISNPFRTQPVIDKDYSDNAIKSLLIARSTENNPWPYWARFLMIREGLRLEGIDLTRIIITPNVRSTGLPVDEIRFPKNITIVYLCPKDEHNKATKKRYIEEGWEIVEVSPSDKCPGSIIIREGIKNDNNWEQYVLSGTANVIKIYQNGPPYEGLFFKP